MDEKSSFALLLRRYRQAAGLTQEALAERAHLSARTVSDLERGNNQRPRPDTLALLADALGLADPERARFERATRRRAAISPERSVADQVFTAQPVGAEMPPRVPTTNLPRALTSFIGRAREQATVTGLLQETPLLTLTGTGGCGKTRLALQVAGDALPAYPDGVWLVELAAVVSSVLVPQETASALGLHEEPGRPLLATLTAFLRGKYLLLVLDNCEHLLLACAELASSLLCVCPYIRILATSREPLRIAGERVWRVQSLSLPDSQLPVTVDVALDSEAVQLFMERARAVQPEFACTAGNVAAVSLVCRHLDGIPLALELAAARLSALSLADLAARLADRFHLLTEGSRTSLPRQQTLRATLEWSYLLLNGAERVLLRRLAVFAGSWTLNAAEVVCTGDGIETQAVLDLLTGLVNKSLIQTKDQGEDAGRYRLLETVRQFALEHLAAQGEASILHERLLNWCLALTEEADRGHQGQEHARRLNQLDAELENLRTALFWTREVDKVGHGLRLANALAWYWHARGLWGEARRWLEGFLAWPIDDLVGEPGLSQAGAGGAANARVRALVIAGQFAQDQNDTDAARNLADRSITLARASKDPASLALALVLRGAVARDEGDFVRSAALLGESAALWSEMDDRRNMLAAALWNQAVTALQHGMVGRAASLAGKCLDLSVMFGTERERAAALFLLGQVAWEQGDLERAAALGEESLALLRRLGEPHAISLTLVFLLARVAREEGDLERAVALSEEGLALARGLGDTGLIGWALLALGPALGEQGYYARAAHALAEGLAQFRARNMRWFAAQCLACLTEVAWARKQAQCAARLAGATDALLSFMGAPLPRGERIPYGRAVAAARVTLGDVAFTAAWTAGRAMALEETIALALELDEATSRGTGSVDAL
jgi:non-specific serine/threonine protein kinase